jgi:putative DNA primase/helicase
MTPLELVLSKIPSAKPHGSGWQALCPAHADRNPSLSISEGKGGRVLLKCHAGCDTKDIMAALKLSMADLMPESKAAGKKSRPADTAQPQISNIYDYCDEAGVLLFQVVRMEPKDFRQRAPRPEGGWTWQVKNIRKVLYQLSQLTDADSNQAIYITEGEKDVDRLRDLGLLATCNPGGAGKWLSEFNQSFSGRKVIIFPDNDTVGQKHAEDVARSLVGIAQSIKIVKLPNLPPKGDVSDWLDAEGTHETLLQLCEAAPEFHPSKYSTTVSITQKWDAIEPLGITNVPPFPIAAYPIVLADFVAAEAEATQTPPDLAAMLCLSTCSASVSKKVEVQVRDQWLEPVNLFTVTVLEPGNRKSAVFSHVTAPLREYEAQLLERERPEVARLEARRRQRERLMKALEDKAVKNGDTDAAREAEEIFMDLATMPEAVLPRLIVDDATSEKLGAMLAEQGGRIASMSPEGGVFDLMAGLYSKSGMPQFGVYLMGHAGDDLRVDRIGRKGEHVKRPALTMGLAIQPSVLEGLLENSAFRGRGLLARFLYSLPESRIGSRKIEPEPVSESIRLAYHNLIWNLCELPWDANQSQYICLADDAWVLLRKFIEKLEPELGSGGELDCIQDWGSKLAGAVARIAGILHCALHADSEPWLHPLAAATMQSAIQIGDYATCHALAAFEAMRADKGLSDAQYLLQWIERHGKRAFAKSEAQQHGKRRFKQASDIDLPLGLLIRHHYIRLSSHTKRGPGRPTSPVYEVNPEFLLSIRNWKSSQLDMAIELEPDTTNLQNIQGALEDSMSGKEKSRARRVKMEI